MTPSPKKMVAPTSWTGVTTVMFRNIPSRYTQHSLLQEIRGEGFSPDYFYLPFDFKKNANAGYAFLNFGHEKEVAAFHARFDGARLAIRSAKFLQVVPAALQGYEANYAHMQHSAVMNHHRAEHGPLFMRESGEPAQVAEESGLYVVRDLPQMYTHELMALELLHHGCGLAVAFLDVPLGPQQLNQGYALLRFTDAQAAQTAVRALQGADFSLAPAALPMSITPVDVACAPRPRALSYVAPVEFAVADTTPTELAPDSAELEQMLAALAEMQAHVAQPLPRSDRFASLDISVEEEKPGLWAWSDLATVSTACDSTRVWVAETPVKRRGMAITPPTRSSVGSTSCSSAESSPRPALAWAPDGPFALPCLLPSPSSCRAIAQGC